MTYDKYQQYVSVALDESDVTAHHKDYTYGVARGSTVTLKPGDRVVVDGKPYGDPDQWGVVTRVYDSCPEGSKRFIIKPILGFAPHTFSGRQPIKAPPTQIERAMRRAALTAAASTYAGREFVTSGDVTSRAAIFEDWLNR